MPWPVHPTGFFGARGDSDTYRIERSLRFNSADLAYLNRTPASAGNRKTWTWSGWVKRGALGSTQSFFGNYFANNDSSQLYVMFDSGNNLVVSLFSFIALTSSSVYRDTSAWYHIVILFDSTQLTASNRLRLYVNGVEVTSFTTDNRASITQNNDFSINAAQATYIGYNNVSGYYFNGYLTEINFIDGQALTPSSFGETDAITGRWKAKAYSGTYGTNGFYLKFADNSGTTSTTLGKDSSGNGNNWTPNNFSVTAGADNDSLVDSPTNYGTDTGVGGNVRGNYATLNPIEGAFANLSLSNGNMSMTSISNSGYHNCSATFSPQNNKGYFEITFPNTPNFGIGVSNANPSSGNYTVSGTIYISLDGNVYNATTSLFNCVASFSSGDVLMFAFDFSSGNKNIWFGKNNSWGKDSSGNTGVPSTGQNPTLTSSTITAENNRFYFALNNGSSLDINFGQRPFAYTAPTGFKALCTQNLPQPTIQKPSKYMDALAYTGTGAANSISSLGFSPDLVWIKNRGTTTDHALYDIVRGAQAQLSSNTTGSEVTSSSGLTAFDSAGFTIGTSSLVNTSGTQYVAWSWDAGSTNSTNTAGSTTSVVRVNPQAGFSVVGYTGNGSAATIGHGLGATPKMIIAKTRSTTGDWVVGHASLDSSSPWGYYIFLSSTAARNSAGAINSWGNNTVVVPPTSTVFSVGNGANLNSNGITYIAYCFAEIEGYSKFGSYTGNGSADGPFVWCGFRPRWVMIKRTDTNLRPWCIHDTGRDISNVSNRELEANSSTAENGGTYPGDLDILSNGLKLREGNSAWINENGGTYIFAAFAESPFKYARAR